MSGDAMKATCCPAMSSTPCFAPLMGESLTSLTVMFWVGGRLFFLRKYLTSASVESAAVADHAAKPTKAASAPSASIERRKTIQPSLGFCLKKGTLPSPRRAVKPSGNRTSRTSSAPLDRGPEPARRCRPGERARPGSVDTSRSRRGYNRTRGCRSAGGAGGRDGRVLAGRGRGGVHPVLADGSGRRRLGRVGEPVHRGRDVRRARARATKRPRGDPGVDQADDGARARA